MPGRRHELSSFIKITTWGILQACSKPNMSFSCIFFSLFLLQDLVATHIFQEVIIMLVCSAYSWHTVQLRRWLLSSNNWSTKDQIPEEQQKEVAALLWPAALLSGQTDSFSLHSVCSHPYVKFSKIMQTWKQEWVAARWVQPRGQLSCYVNRVVDSDLRKLLYNDLCLSDYIHFILEVVINYHRKSGFQVKVGWAPHSHNKYFVAITGMWNSLTWVKSFHFHTKNPW